MTWDERAERRKFVKRVLQRMDDLDLTRQELADRIGSSRSSVSVQLDPAADAWMAGDKMLRLAWMGRYEQIGTGSEGVLVWDRWRHRVCASTPTGTRCMASAGYSPVNEPRIR